MGMTPEEIRALELEAVTLGEKMVKQGKVTKHQPQHKEGKGGKHAKGGKGGKK